MKNLTILKTICALALASGLTLSSASAKHRDGIGYTIAQVEHATDMLLLDYKRELVDRGLWKPRGHYSHLWVAIHRMEEYADSLKKHHNGYTNRAALLKVAGIIDRHLHRAEEEARYCRVSGRVHSGLRKVSAATHSLTGYCRGGGEVYDNDRGRGYDRGHGYDRRREYDRGRGYRDGRHSDRRRRPYIRSGSPYHRTFHFRF